MRACKDFKRNIVAFLSGELTEEEKGNFISHLDTCSDCQREFQETEGLIKGADSLQPDIDQAMASVDWEALPAKITETVFQEEKVPSRKSWLAGFSGWISQPRLRPVLAGILVGILIGSLATILIFQSPWLKEDSEPGFMVSQEFLDRVDLEMARRETLDYLDKSQYLLLDFVRYSPERETELWMDEFAVNQAKDLLSKKKYINPQLKKLRMAKAKAICDQIEFLFYELTQVKDALTKEDHERIQRLIEEKQLLLKINLLKKELRESEV
jgi:hypothetical protein